MLVLEAAYIPISKICLHKLLVVAVIALLLYSVVSELGKFLSKKKILSTVLLFTLI